MVIHLGCSQVKLLLKLAVKLVAVMWVTMLWGQTQQDLQCHAAGFLGNTLEPSPWPGYHLQGTHSGQLSPLLLYNK